MCVYAFRLAGTGGATRFEGNTMSTQAATLTVEGFLSTIMRFTTAMEANTAILERVVEGQKAAMDAHDAARGGTTTRTPRKGKETPAVTETKTEEPAVVSFLPTVAVGDTDGLKAQITPWLQGAEKGSDESKARIGFLKDLAGHLKLDPKNFFGPCAAD